MNLPQFSVKRPVTTTMIFLALALLGIISWQRLPQELFPPITYPQLTISTNYQNAAPEEIETLITKPLEEVVGTVSGLKRISSISKEGLSLITLEFSWGSNMDFASLNVREKIDLVKERLPREADDPIIMKFNPFELPVMMLSITQSAHGEYADSDFQQAELLRLSKKYIKDELEKVTGVAYGRITGGLEREISVELDQGRLFASNLSILDVVEALRRTNLDYPAGTIEGDFYEYLIRTMGEFKKVSELNDVPVSLDEFKDYSKIFQPEDEQENRKQLIFLSDVGKVKDAYKEITNYSRYNGKDNISISIFKQSDANTVAVSEDIRKVLKKLEDELPKGIIIKIIYDQSVFIRDSINGVTNSAVLGGILAFLVLMVFLWNFRSSLIIVISIPVSILVVFSLMYMRGISLNIISLGGLALGVGMLVDNSIVVIENIYRHRSEGKDEKTAAIDGSTEVTGAIASSTLTTVAVFLPMIYVVGIAGQIFRELAFTVTFSLLASLVVALTVVPLMCSGKGRKTYSEDDNTPGARFSNRLENLHIGLLKIFLNNKKKGLLIVFALFVFSLLIFFILDKEFMPKVDEGQFIIKISMPAGTLLDVTDKIGRKIEKILMEDKNVKDVMVNVGSGQAEAIGKSLAPHQAEVRVNLIKARKIKTDEFIGELKEKIEGLSLKENSIEYIIPGSALASSFKENAPIIIEIKGEDLNTLSFLTEEVEKALGGICGIYGVKDSFEATSPETKINIIKDKAWLYNLSVSDIATVVQAALRGYIPTKFKDQGQEINIKVRLKLEDRKDFSTLNRLLIHTPLGTDVSLAEVADLAQGKGPSVIERLDKERAVTISANLTGRKLSQVIAEINQKLKDIKVPSGYKIRLGGESKEMKESFASLAFALILSFILIYMIMAAQFESLWQPFIIMFSVPLSIIGVALALLLTNTSINVIALLGVIILGGIVVNNGIVLVDYINTLVIKYKMMIPDAVIEASKTRLRPILMTTLTTILGLVPLALSLGEESDLQSPMAITVIGGLLVSTFLTLLVIPAISLRIKKG